MHTLFEIFFSMKFTNRVSHLLNLFRIGLNRCYKKKTMIDLKVINMKSCSIDGNVLINAIIRKIVVFSADSCEFQWYIMT